MLLSKAIFDFAAKLDELMQAQRSIGDRLSKDR